jgi:UDP-N-acetylmuramyl pentapeptide phosphotransferase/UDP-N-acetylglucosamine-1-phosphate transferase
MSAVLSFWPLAVVCALVAAASCAATGMIRTLLLQFHILDRPNARSSHSVATPRGGGLALLPLLLVAWLLWQADAIDHPPGFEIAVIGAVWLVLVSWLDDLRDLPAIVRLLGQALAVAVALFAMADAGPLFQGLLPPLLDRLAAGLLWLWFINLFNFMDGIDGITGVEAIAVGLGLGLVAWLLGLGSGEIALPWLLAAAVAGFLVWNWAPAKLFLGDVGSVPLGFLLGWLLLLLAARGAWAAALILPAYYLADASVTLLRRAARRARLWQAHREHFYQRAVAGGHSHARVSLAIAGCNLLLLGLALAAAWGYAWPALAGAGVVVTLFLLLLQRWSRLGLESPGD